MRDHGAALDSAITEVASILDRDGLVNTLDTACLATFGTAVTFAPQDGRRATTHRHHRATADGRRLYARQCAGHVGDSSLRALRRHQPAAAAWRQDVDHRDRVRRGRRVDVDVHAEVQPKPGKSSVSCTAAVLSTSLPLGDHRETTSRIQNAFGMVVGIRAVRVCIDLARTGPC
jgi:hypothetical protein